MANCGFKCYFHTLCQYSMKSVMNLCLLYICKISCYSHVGSENAVEQLQLRQVKRSLQLVVVEGDFPRSRAVQPGLHKGGPRVLQEEATADVILTYTPCAGKYRPATVMLHCVFPEEEVGEVADIVGGDKVWFC